MKLTLKNTPEQVELIRAMGSKNLIAAREASEAFAAFLGPVIQEVLLQAGTAGSIYSDAPFDEDDSPSYPLDLYYNESKNFITVWSQNMAGGLPASHVAGLEELKIATYRLDSAVTFNKRYARRARLDVISKAVERMAQEVLVKQERNAWAVILKALAEASTTTDSGDSLKHVVRTSAGSVTGYPKEFSIDDLNNLMVRIKRLNESFAGGTPAATYSRGLTDLYASPERLADIRSFAYTAVGGSSDGRTVTDLPEDMRSDIYRNAGMASIYGVNINEMIELGVGKKYNTLFDSLAGATSFTDINGANGAVFAATEEIVVGLDNSKGAFIRPIARQAENGSSFTAVPDDQYNITRVDKAGFYGSLEEGRVCIDSRAIAGLLLTVGS
jgi:hypothetical protein